MDGTPESVVRRYAGLSRLADASDFGPLDRNVVVLDTETTGVSFNHDELTQIAAARLERGRITEWFVTFVNPGKPIPEDVAHLTNIHDADVADAPTPQQALEQLVEFVGDAKVVAHNVGFDRTFTTRHPEGYPLLENVWIDSLDLARIALPRMKSHRLLDLVRAFDAPLSTHRADADVEATCAMYRILLAAVEAMPPALTVEIADLPAEGLWSTQFVFKVFAAEYRRMVHGSLAASDEGAQPALEPACGVAGELPDQPQELQGQFDLLLAEADMGAGIDRYPMTVPGAVVRGNADVRFSLRSLRHRRAGDTAPPKRDAEVLAEDPSQGLRFADSAQVDEAFSTEGAVGSLYDDYEPRPAQLAMAQAVNKAFSTSENLVVEAGTGVGKSMAYLVPSAYAALMNDVTVGVATKTNALLDQLVYKELPALADSLAAVNPDAPRLTYAPLKGFSHYPCLHKVDNLLRAGVGTRLVNNVEMPQAPAVAGLLSFIEQSDIDDMDSLKIDYRALPRPAITTGSLECLRRKCPYYGNGCFVFGARRRAEASHIVVTNHSLLFCDVVADGGLLPPARFWVIDEAHSVEDEARRAFSLKISAEELLSMASKANSASSRRDMFARVESRIQSVPGEKLVLADREAANAGIGVSSADAEGNDTGDAGSLFCALVAKGRRQGVSFREAVEQFNGAMKGLLYFDQAKGSKRYETTELWVNETVRASAVFRELSLAATALKEVSERLASACQGVAGYLEGIEGMADSQREFAALACDLKGLVNALEVIFERPEDTYVYSAMLNKHKDRWQDSVEAQLLNVGDALNETLFARTFSVVFASATLSVDGKFDSFANAIGLDQGEQSQAAKLALQSHYRFDEQMTIYVPTDMPEPNDPAYLGALQRLLTETHRAQQGSMLTLFTNRREMEACYEVVRDDLKGDDLRVVCQKWGVSVKGLRDDFLADEHLSLFALKSFWEGFDAPGSTLRGVIIPKLPFAKPSDPLSCERAARDDAAWRRYVLPAAVLETKQAAGRLIRKADDSGVLILADGRLLTKSYGKMFLRSMPSKTVKTLTCAEIVEELRQAAAHRPAAGRSAETGDGA